MHSYPEVNNQESRFFFLFPFCQKDSAANPREMAEVLLSVRLPDLLKLPFLPQALKDRKTQNDDINSEKKDQRIWLRAEQNLSEDLHPHIVKILGRPTEGAGADHEQGSFRALQFHKLTPEARNVLTGGWGRLGLGFKVALSASARRRLGVPDGKPLTVRALINDAFLQFFRSGIGILILECSYRCDSEDLPLAKVILEANYHLCHAGKQASNSLSWANKGKEEALENESAFSLNEFARSLIAGAVQGEADHLTTAPQHIEWMTRTRVFSYSAVQFRSPFADSDVRRQFAYRLCNKYTSDYSVHEERIRSTLVSVFDNVLHGASIEGGCIVVEEAEVDFLKTYVSNVGRLLYLPLAIVSFHEFRHLLAVTQEATLYVNCDKPAEEEVAQLRRLKHDLINFHLFFRFSHASMISHHNMVHKAWREAFSLDRMLEEVTSDVVEAEKVLLENVERLAADAEREKERRWRVWSTAATGGAAYFTISRVLEIWVQKMYLAPTLQLAALKVRANLLTISDFAALQVQSGRIELVCETVALFVAIALAVFVYRIKPKSGSSGH